MYAIGYGIGVCYAASYSGVETIYVSSGSIVYRKKSQGGEYTIDYSCDGGVTYVELASFQLDEELLVMLVDDGLAGYRQVIRGGVLCIDHELTPTGFAGVQDTDWEEDEAYPYAPALILAFDNIANVPAVVTDPSDVSLWNTFFDLPTYGTAFTSVEVFGNSVLLRGGSGISLKDYLFSSGNQRTHILAIIDQINCIDDINDYVFGGEDTIYACINLTQVYLPAVINVGVWGFLYCISLTNIDLSACTSLGATVGNDNIFTYITGNTITLTVPAALMTCNAGSPDGDIVELQTNNTVTIITT